MIQHYNLLRGWHILAVIAWMSGMLYLPRLFAYHTRAEPGSRGSASCSSKRSRPGSACMALIEAR